MQQCILWLLTVCSVSAKSSLQVYYDLTHKQICVESFVVKQSGAGLDTKVGHGSATHPPPLPPSLPRSLA